MVEKKSRGYHFLPTHSYVSSFHGDNYDQEKHYMYTRVAIRGRLDYMYGDNAYSLSFYKESPDHLNFLKILILLEETTRGSFQIVCFEPCLWFTSLTISVGTDSLLHVRV